MCRKLLQFVIGCGKLGEGLDKWIRGGSVRVARWRARCAGTVLMLFHPLSHTHTHQFDIFSLRLHGDNRMHNIASVFFNGIRPAPPPLCCHGDVSLHNLLFSVLFFFGARYARSFLLSPSDTLDWLAGGRLV